MTDLVLSARMRAAGIEPALYTPEERARIAIAMRDLPPPLPAPVIPAPALDRAALQCLTAAIDRALDCVLAALTTDAVFAREAITASVEHAADAICTSLPRWQAQAASLVEDAGRQIRASAEALDAARQAEADCAMLIVAARLAGAESSPYTAVQDAHRAATGEAEAALAHVTARLDALAQVFDWGIPRLLSAMAAEPLVLAEVRSAALALRADLPR